MGFRDRLGGASGLRRTQQEQQRHHHQQSDAEDPETIRERHDRGLQVSLGGKRGDGLFLSIQRVARLCGEYRALLRDPILNRRSSSRG
jgi:hypothetical protein